MAMGLLAVLGVGVVSAYWKIMDMQRVSDRWTDSDQVHALITAALSDSANCANNLRDHAGMGVNPVTINTTDVDVSEIDQGVARSILKSQGLSPFSSEVTYDLQLQLPAGLVSAPAAGFAAGYGRASVSKRYLATLNVVAFVRGLTSQSVAQIPISMEFDNMNTLASCTLNPDDTDESLYLNQHTSRQCIAQGGMPFPSALGMLCRFPMTTVQTNVAATCPSVGGWFATAYTSSVARDFIYQSCSGSKTQWVGWHYFSNNAGPSGVEQVTLTDIKKGTSKAFNWQVFGGAAGGEMILYGVIGSLLGPFALLPIALGFIFAFTNCSTDPPYTVYSQALAIGCY
jgi:hypothetical protein